VCGDGVFDVDLLFCEVVLLEVLVCCFEWVFLCEELFDRVFDDVDIIGLVDIYVYYLCRKLGCDVVCIVCGSGYWLGSV